VRRHARSLHGEVTTAAESPSDRLRRAVFDGLTGYINAGGRGTRLNEVFDPDPTIGISKALLEIGRRPIPLINHHINRLASVGISTIIAGVGDHRNVAQHVRTAYRGNPNVHVIEAETQLGNGGDLVMAARTYRQLFSGPVLVSNCDTILDVDEMALAVQHYLTGAGLTIALTEKKGVPNEGAFYVGNDSSVVYSAEATTEPPTAEVRERTTYQASSTGALIVESELLRNMNWSPEDGSLSLYRDVVGSALGQDALYGYNNGINLFIDVGTVDTWRSVTEHPEIVASVLAY
jgi:NDP-sugar pyrophosphorylase family protein